MAKPVLALVLGTLAALQSSDCGMPPGSPRSESPTMSGTWSGTGSDSQGPESMAWQLTQTGDLVTGTAITRGGDTTDGTCASCHKNKSGTLSGTISGNSLRVTMFFPTGGDVPTPICSVTMDATASDITTRKIAGTYTGEDTCEGPFSNGAFTLDHLP
jgi:hypothetical protein